MSAIRKGEAEQRSQIGSSLIPPPVTPAEAIAEQPAVEFTQVIQQAAASALIIPTQALIVANVLSSTRTCAQAAELSVPVFDKSPRRELRTRPVAPTLPIQPPVPKPTVYPNQIPNWNTMLTASDQQRPPLPDNRVPIHAVNLQINAQIALFLGDLETLAIPAIGNAAKRDLQGGRGVDFSVHMGAGPRLALACKKYAPRNVGEAVITSGFNLPAR